MVRIIKEGVEDMRILGIDPGLTGGMATIGDGFIAQAFVLPVIQDCYGKRKLASNSMLMTMRSAQADVICIERVSAMPGQGVTSMFTFGKIYGQLITLADLACSKVIYVTPQKWKKDLNISSDKQTAINRCAELFPNVNVLATERCKKPHLGMVEALLIGYWCKEFNKQ